MGQVGKHGSFFLDSAVERSGSVYNATVHEAWGIAGNANGGYLMAIAARAMAGVSRPHPVSLTAHFLAPGTPGPVTIRPQVIKAGHRFTTVRASLSSEERQLVELLGSFSDLADVEGPVHIDAAPPDLPAPEDCIRVVPDPSGFPPPLMSKVDMRLHPEDSVFAGRFGVCHGSAQRAPVVSGLVPPVRGNHGSIRNVACSGRIPANDFQRAPADCMDAHAGTDCPCSRAARAWLASLPFQHPLHLRGNAGGRRGHLG
jgi:hypothetical protein